jgi:hypothetical protein
MGVEPMNTGFADQRVSHFATGASRNQQSCYGFDGSHLSHPDEKAGPSITKCLYFGCAAVRIYGFTVLKPGKSWAASSLDTTPAMMTSSPTFQFAGVDTLCFVVS